MKSTRGIVRVCGKATHKNARARTRAWYQTGMVSPLFLYLLFLVRTSSLTPLLHSLHSLRSPLSSRNPDLTARQRHAAAHGRGPLALLGAAADGPQNVHGGKVNVFGDSAEERERYASYFSEAQSECWKVTVEPGEILYWQSHWWHATNVPFATEAGNATPAVTLMASYLDGDVI